VPGVLTRGRAYGNRRGRTPVAVIDIGSNSIRLVVYEGAQRAPTPVFNEKVLCGLARGLDKTGRLAEERVEMALAALTRFRALVHVMGVDRVDVVATSAVRDAENGGDFVAAVRARCGFDMRVLTGEEEARLSAFGALSGIPDANGVMGDLGGGSLELVSIDGGSTADFGTFPLGPLRLIDVANGSVPKAKKIIDERIAAIPWLPGWAGKTFYPVGGAWRMLASVHMAKTHYPLHVIHQYTISSEEAVEFARFVGKLGERTLKSVPGVSRQRLESVPYAAYLFERVLLESRVDEVVFCAYGVREGCLYDRLSPRERRIDPLLAISQREAERMGRATADGEVLFDWISPIFADETPRQGRLRLAACHLADIGWSEHPDYRAEMVFSRILRHPVVGTDHPGRLFMALAVASRHSALDPRFIRREAGSMLKKEEMELASIIGLAMRLAYTFSGGVISLLQQARLGRDRDRLTLSLPEHADILVGDVVARRFRALARALDCKADVVFGGPQAETGRTRISA
jgi:exopolyphosphatase/guanosine-5'-triphosphate,3'-diphosphate pyrophosphatase